MKLFTRLIDAGVFIFWSLDGEDATVNLKIKISAGDEKITLIDIKPEVGQNCYSLDRVGSGDYEIELNAYKNGVLCQTETKNIKIISSTQKNEENMQTLLGGMGSLKSGMITINDNMVAIYNLLVKMNSDIGKINNVLTDPKTMKDVEKRIKHYAEFGWY